MLALCAGTEWGWRGCTRGGVKRGAESVHLAARALERVYRCTLWRRRRVHAATRAFAHARGQLGGRKLAPSWMRWRRASHWPWNGKKCMGTWSNRTLVLAKPRHVVAAPCFTPNLRHGQLSKRGVFGGLCALSRHQSQRWLPCPISANLDPQRGGVVASSECGMLELHLSGLGVCLIGVETAAVLLHNHLDASSDATGALSRFCTSWRRQTEESSVMTAARIPDSYPRWHASAGPGRRGPAQRRLSYPSSARRLHGREQIV